MSQLAVNFTRYLYREVTAAVSSLRDNYHCESRIRERRIRGKGTNPTALADAGSGLAGNGLSWIIRLASSAVINRAHHTRHHTLPNICRDG
jgi:hypothetical protein